MIAGSPYSKMCRKSKRLNSMKWNLVEQHPLCIYLKYSREEHSDFDLLFFWPLRGTSVFVGHIEWPHCVCFKNISSEETAAVISVSLFSALLEGMILRSDMAVKWKLSKQDHLRMNVAPDRTIILGLQIVLDHRSLVQEVKISGWDGTGWDGMGSLNYLTIRAPPGWC